MNKLIHKIETYIATKVERTIIDIDNWTSLWGIYQPKCPDTNIEQLKTSKKEEMYKMLLQRN